MGLLRLLNGLGIMITAIGFVFYLYRIVAGEWPWGKRIDNQMVNNKRRPKTTRRPKQP
mgnify:FL=1